MTMDVQTESPPTITSTVMSVMVNGSEPLEETVVGSGGDYGDPLQTLTLAVKTFLMGLIIAASIFGNLLVIISVFRFRKLRIITNYFVVSLAMADILVALVAMCFNASVIIFGRWLFGYIMCDIWNSFDVYFSTVSILHLCCISVDRYYAISQPLMYPIKITRKKVAVMLTNVWIWPGLISYVPILLGWYTTDEHLEYRAKHPDRCQFVVNKVYAVISSSISFWIPCTIMLFTYYRIYQMASKQEKMLQKNTDAALLFRQQNQRRSAETEQLQLHHQLQKVNSPSPKLSVPENQVAVAGGRPLDVLPDDQHQANGKSPGMCSSEVTLLQISLGPSSVSEPAAKQMSGSDRSALLLVSDNGDAETHSTPTKDKHFQKIRREHKAARTLGIIMGAFVLCWLPFFIWYLSITLCGEACYCPDIVVEVLFWIGYFNSTLNPLIYAYFNKDFREAFRNTLLCVFCGCCWDKRQTAGGGLVSGVHRGSSASYAHMVRTTVALSGQPPRIRHSNSGDTITGIERIENKRLTHVAV